MLDCDEEGECGGSVDNEANNVQIAEKLKEIQEELGVSGKFGDSVHKNKKIADGSRHKEEEAGGSGEKKEKEINEEDVYAFENEDSGVEEESNEEELFDEDDMNTLPVPDSEPILENDEDTDPEGEGDDESSDSPYNSNEDRMALSSCDESDSEYPEFNDATDMADPQFRMGMLFSSAQVFRAAVRMHAIKHQRGVRLKKNLGNILKWVCMKGCDWKCYARKQQRSSAFQIKSIYTQHTCNPVWEQKQLTASWIAEQYEEQIRMNPTWPVEDRR